MNRKILLPTDFSKNALYAISYAIELYKNEKCQFFLLNVFSRPDDKIVTLLNMEPGSKLYETAKLESENSLAQVLDMITLREDNNPKHHFEVITKYGKVLEAITNTVEEKDIDLIVMGTRGTTPSASKFFGSVALNVMEKVRNCPVIVVPEKSQTHKPKEIVFPSSFKTHLKKRELDYLIDLANNCKASIRILHVKKEHELSDEQLSNKKLLEEYFKGIDHSFHMLSKGDISSTIQCFVESRESDMVAFINKRHAFFKSSWTQPLEKELVYEFNAPFLVMHDLRN